MGKPKKGKKGKGLDDELEDALMQELEAIQTETGGGKNEEKGTTPQEESTNEESATNNAKQKKKEGKKGKKKKGDWDEEDLLNEVESMKAEQEGKTAPEKDTTKDSGPPGDEVTEEPAGKKGKKGKKKKKGGWDDLEDELANEVEAMKLEDEGKGTPKPAEEEATKDSKDSAPPEEAALEEPAGKKGKKAKKKKKGAWDEDELLEEVEAMQSESKATTSEPADQAKVEETFTTTAKEFEKDKQKEEPKETENGDGPVLKTAAQKRAEKKEREKEKKKKQKQKQEGIGKKKDEDAEKERPQEEKEGKDKEDSKAEAGADGDEAATVEDEDEEEDSKKKKKKKKGKKDEEDKEKKKKPGKGQLKLMQELLKKQKEDEERLRLEEEAKQKAAEEAEERRLEAIRLEKERKDRKKQKEKERIQRQKEQGTYLTKAQKEAKRVAEVKLAALKEQGVIVPSKDNDQKSQRIKYGGRVRKKKGQQQEEETEKTETTEEKSPTQEEEEVSKGSDEAVTEEAENAAEVEEDSVAESWDQKEEDDIKDNWDDEDEQVEEVPKTEVTVKSVKEKKPSVTDTEEEEDEEEDDDDDDDDEDDDEDEDDHESESESESESEDEESEDDGLTTAEKIRERALDRIKKRREKNEANRSVDNLRCPIICVLGHVDTGKTKILDKIRHTNVQDGEAGGITQQIGATMVPKEAIREQTKMCREFVKADLKVEGLLIIDTPGHESFSNLRSRGSSLCDFAILVVDIMHGLEPQTIESLNLLRSRKTPFIVALNKIDRLYEWKASPHSEVQNTVKKQKPHTREQFDVRTKAVITEFAEQGMNAALFHENPDIRTYISLVPTSAHSGDGMGNLIALIVELSQSMLTKRLAFSEELECTTMEVKALPGLGTTIDVVLVNGRLREGDTIVVAGQEGPIVTQLRGVLTTQPLKELRVKNQYVKHKELKGAYGVKLLAKDMEKALAGLPLLVANHPDEVEILKEEISEILEKALQCIKLTDRGVYVQASTLGSLEALLEFLRTSKIPYAGINIGPVHRKDVMKASIMLEHDRQYAVILAFDVKIEREAQEMADKEGIQIFQADIIYHLFDSFTKHLDDLKERKRQEFKHLAVFPCKLKVMPQYIFNARNPIVVGVLVEGGIVKEGTPLIVPSKENLEIGVISSLELNHKVVETARKGQEVCIKIENVSGDAPKMYGRHFDHNDMIVSKISRESIDAVKTYFRDDLEKPDWQVMIELKKLLEIL